MTAERFDLEHWIHANAAGECGGCLSSITVGERICRDTENGWWHLDCAITASFSVAHHHFWCQEHRVVLGGFYDRTECRDATGPCDVVPLQWQAT